MTVQGFTKSPNMDAYRSRVGEMMMWVALSLFLSVPAWADIIRLVSDFQSTPPSGGNGDSCLPIVSADGRYVLFASSANNLLLSTNGLPIPSVIPAPFNVYLRDRSGQVTTLVSVSTNGTAGGNGNSVPLALSTNGQFALFESSANNLVAGDTNNASDIYLRDLANGITLLVSVNTNGVPANGASRNAVMTPDGRLVAFVSEASNLVAGDTNKIPDVFLRDLQAQTTTLISVGAVSTNPAVAVGSSDSPAISFDGRFVAFSSTATNLVPGVLTAGDIYVHDRVAGTNLWVSSGMRAQLQAAKGKTNGVCYNLALSEDGKIVAYQASLSPLGGSTNSGIILRYSLETGLTDLIHTNAPTSIPVPEETRNLGLAPDGSVFAFVANSNGVQATTTCVQVWNAASGAMTLASGNLFNGVTAGSLSMRPVMDASGRYVAFLSSATNLVTNSISGQWHVYVRDLLTMTTTLVDAGTNGSGASVTISTVPSLSADGRFVAFECPAGGLVPDDNNRCLDLFVRDLVAGTNELISMHDASLGSVSASAPSTVSAFGASADGRFIAYASEVDQAPADTNGFRDVFVRDFANNSNVLLSCDSSGVAGNGVSSEPAVSGNGRFVVFTSSATNLVNGDNNGMTDIFVRDLQTGITVLASLDSAGGPADGNSYSPSLSSDGRWMLFRSQAKDLAAGSFSGTENLFLRDLQLGTNYALTTRGVVFSAMTPDGRFVAFVGTMPGFSSPYLYVWDSVLSTRVFTNTANGINNPAISADGNLVAFNTASEIRLVDRSVPTNWLVASLNASSRPVPRFSLDGNWLTYTRNVAASNQVFLYDIQNRTETLVSHAVDSTFGSAGHSDSPELTADGRFVAYRTLATNIVPGLSGNRRQIILYDRQSGLNTLLSANRSTGAPGDDDSLRVRFSADSQTLLVQSWASDLVANDFNRSGDVLAHAIFTAVILPSANPDEGPWLYWPLVPGSNTGVQFKTKIDDPIWQPAMGIMTNGGNKVWFQDGYATNSQRFYRIWSN